MKKEYLLLVVAIVVLAALLVYQKKGKTNYQLPQLQSIDASVNRLVVKEGDRVTELRQVDGSWVVGPKSYRADQSRAAKMVDEIRNLQLVALISEKENYQLYELNRKKRFTVQLYHDQTLLREVMVGKNSPSLRQTYVMLKDDAKVYQALGNLRSNLFSEIDDLRDKEILKISAKERDLLDKIVIERVADGKQESLEIVKVKAVAKATKAGDEPPTEGSEDNSIPASKWQLKDGKEVVQNAVSSLLSTLSGLKCSKYLDDLNSDAFENPAYRVTVSGADKTFFIAFLEAEKDQYRAFSSQAEQPFLLPAWQAKQIMKEFTAYTGTKKKVSETKK